MTKKRILVCEDNNDICFFLDKFLKSEGYLVDIVNDGLECLNKYSDAYDLLLLDVNVPQLNGIEVLKKIINSNPKAKIIIITALTKVELVVKAMKIGAHNYIKKPFDNDSLLAAISEAINAKSTTNEISFDEAYCKLTKSPKMKEAYNIVDKVCSKNVSIILRGESGTGKELFVKLIHSLSNRNKAPLVTVNCPAIPNNLFESELFGHEKGSFTGAHEKKIGKFEQAHGGTIFLDEITDLYYESQAKLLRTLQEGEIEPVGSRKKKKIDVRVICASSRDLKYDIHENKFRLDLYYRLSDIEICLPPLRERKEDIPLLVEFLSKNYAQENNETYKPFSSNSLHQLKEYNWPGNIRELKSVIRKVLILSSEKSNEINKIPKEYLLTELSNNKSTAIDSNASVLESSLHGNEKESIENALKMSDYNISKASRSLKIGRATLYRKIKKHNIKY